MVAGGGGGGVLEAVQSVGVRVGSFRKNQGYLVWGPYNKDPTIEGTKGPLFSETPVLGTRVSGFRLQDARADVS